MRIIRGGGSVVSRWWLGGLLVLVAGCVEEGGTWGEPSSFAEDAPWRGGPKDKPDKPDKPDKGDDDDDAGSGGGADKAWCSRRKTPSILVEVTDDDGPVAGQEVLINDVDGTFIGSVFTDADGLATVQRPCEKMTLTWVQQPDGGEEDSLRLWSIVGIEPGSEVNLGERPGEPFGDLPDPMRVNITAPPTPADPSIVINRLWIQECIQGSSASLGLPLVDMPLRENCINGDGSFDWLIEGRTDTSGYDGNTGYVNAFGSNFPDNLPNGLFAEATTVWTTDLFNVRATLDNTGSPKPYRFDVWLAGLKNGNFFTDHDETLDPVGAGTTGSVDTTNPPGFLDQLGFQLVFQGLSRMEGFVPDSSVDGDLVEEVVTPQDFLPRPLPLATKVDGLWLVDPGDSGDCRDGIARSFRSVQLRGTEAGGGGPRWTLLSPAGDPPVVVPDVPTSIWDESNLVELDLRTRAFALEGLTREVFLQTPFWFADEAYEALTDVGGEWMCESRASDQPLFGI